MHDIITAYEHLQCKYLYFDEMMYSNSVINAPIRQRVVHHTMLYTKVMPYRALLMLLEPCMSVYKCLLYVMCVILKHSML